MAINRHSLRRSFMASGRKVEGEGVLRMIFVVLILAMPLAAFAILKIHDMRLGYEMRDIQDRIRREEELTRALELERSRLTRPDVIQQWASEAGFVPTKSTNVVRRPFTPEDQRTAKLKPVSSV